MVLQIIAFCFHLRLTQSPNIFGNFVFCSFHNHIAVVKMMLFYTYIGYKGHGRAKHDYLGV